MSNDQTIGQNYLKNTGTIAGPYVDRDHDFYQFWYRPKNPSTALPQSQSHHQKPHRFPVVTNSVNALHATFRFRQGA
jgi:hypothetical protein